jgi:hypothetical protein
MRRRLIATTALIALAAILVLGVPLGLVESARARSDAYARLEREADGIAAAIDDRAEGVQGVDAAVLSPWLRPGHAAVIAAGGKRITVGRCRAAASCPLAPAPRRRARQGLRVRRRGRPPPPAGRGCWSAALP